VGAKFSVSVQTGSEAHPTSTKNGTGPLFPVPSWDVVGLNLPLFRLYNEGNKIIIYLCIWIHMGLRNLLGGLKVKPTTVKTVKIMPVILL
jgi:hypothetical protein